MTDMKNPLTEQEICVTCGFCCDGTLFSTATLEKGEKGKLPEKMVAAYGKNGDYEFFTLPCAYFDQKCTIYNQKKAHVCSSFRCKLLKDFDKNERTQQEALDIVANAMQLKEEVQELYASVFESDEIIHFRKVIEKIGWVEENLEKAAPLHPSFHLLKIKAIILDTLLLKYFKSQESFEKMIEK